MKRVFTVLILTLNVVAGALATTPDTIPFYNLTAGPSGLTSRDHRDIIFDDQTYYYDRLYQMGSISGVPNWKQADDVEVEDPWELELIKAWLVGSEPGDDNMLVEIFADSGDGPLDGPDQDQLLYSEMVSEEGQSWTFTGDYFDYFPIFEVDIPIQGFEIEPLTRYWISLQYQGGVNIYWAMMNHRDYGYWDPVFMYFEGEWVPAGSGIFEEYAAFFELHGTPADVRVETRSFGSIKAAYGEY